ncbi:MAG TPA: hypothetical protein VLT13_07110 [Bacteroidota bacterium]|nr:hypothetical protein [Bacteroidota bacterium]
MRLWWLIPASILFLTTGVKAQEDVVRTDIKQFVSAEGAPLYKLWFFVNRIGFRYRGEEDLMRRLDENQEEETMVMYDEGGVRKQLQVIARIALENGPPVSPTLTKEHEIRNLTVWLEMLEDDDEVASFKLRAENFTVKKNADVTASMEPFKFRGVTFTPSVRYLPLQDLATTEYYIRMDGLSFALVYPQ